MVELRTPAGAQDSPWQPPDPRLRARRRVLLWTVGVCFVASIAVAGVPTGREWLTLWVLLALLAAVGGNLAAWRRAVVRDWLPFLSVLFAYDLSRGVANKVGGALFDLPSWRSNPALPAATARAHLLEPIRLERALFGGQVPTVWLQQHLFHPGSPRWWDRVAVAVYLTHFVVSVLVAIVLWCRSYRLFRPYLAALVTLIALALTTYLLYPAAPPWMASLNGHLPPVYRVVETTLTNVGGDTTGTVVEHAAVWSNPVAAMPSLHAAIPLLLLLMFFRRAPRWLRPVLVLYPVAMGLALVYTGEHYVVDVLLGWLYAVATVALLGAVRRRRSPG